MEQIAEWLKRIVTIIIFAGFLEMLLPNNNLKGVTRLVLGLLVMVILLQPLVNVFKIPLDIESAFDGNGRTEPIQPATGEIIQTGQKLRDNWKTLFKEKDAQRLKARIKQALALIDGIQIIEVFIDDDGVAVKKITVAAHSNQPRTLQEENNLNDQIRKILYLTINLPEEQIEVKWDA